MLERPKLVIYADSVETYACIRDRFPEVSLHVADTADGIHEAIADAEIVFMARKYRRETLLLARSLKWLHVAGAGVDRLRPFSDFAPHITITRTPTLNAGMIADYVICVISMLAWKFPRLLLQQREQIWHRWPVERLDGKTLVVIGLGKIGSAVAIRATTMGMLVIGVRRRQHRRVSFAHVVEQADLPEVLPQADFVVVSAPLTSETEGMIGAEEFQLMKQSAHLINVGRGAIVHEDALIHALERKQISGAALDVFEEEPLPPHNRLWELPNVIVTPHISSWSTDYGNRAIELFCANLKRYLAGQPLLHVVERSREY